MGALRTLGEVVSLAWKSFPVVECLAWHFVADAEFSDESDVIAALLYLLPVGLLDLRRAQRGGEIEDTVSSGVLAQHDAGAAGAANRRGAEMIVERDTFLREAVELRCMDDSIAGMAERIGALIVGQHEENVRALGWMGRLRRSGLGGYCGDGGSFQKIASRKIHAPLLHAVRHAQSGYGDH